MKFNSQICTTKEQSERLLALGLKKKTADCSWNTVTLHGTPITYPSQESWLDYSIISDNHFPAWSLHRLIEMYSEHYVCEHINLKLLTYDTIIENIRLDILTETFNKEYLEQ